MITPSAVKSKEEVIMTPSQEKNVQQRLAFAEFIKLYPLTIENLDGEEWRAIDGFDGYQVSTHGRIKTLRNGRNHILKPHLFNHYLAVGLQRSDGEQRGYSIHRLVAKTFIVAFGIDKYGQML